MKNSKLFDNVLSSKDLEKIVGGVGGGITKVTSDIWTDGVNTYEDSTWSDGSEVCGQFLGCDCGGVNNTGSTTTNVAATSFATSF